MKPQKPKQTHRDQFLALPSRILKAQASASGENKVDIINAHSNEMFGTVEFFPPNVSTNVAFGHEVFAQISIAAWSGSADARLHCVENLQSYLESIIRRDILKAATTLEDTTMYCALETLVYTDGLLRFFPKADKKVYWHIVGEDRIQYDNMSIIIGADKSLTAQVEHRNKVYTKIIPFDLHIPSTNWATAAIEFFVSTRKSLGLKV